MHNRLIDEHFKILLGDNTITPASDETTSLSRSLSHINVCQLSLGTNINHSCNQWTSL